MIQPLNKLEKWFSKKDPWGYETSQEDIKRKNILLSEIPERKYENVLDIGCGHGFITRELPGEKVTGIDISKKAIQQAKKNENRRLIFQCVTLFDLPQSLNSQYDLIIITGVLYPQYIGKSLNLVYSIISDILVDSGILITVHIDTWYTGRFPFLLMQEYLYDYHEYVHRLEVYIK